MRALLLPFLLLFTFTACDLYDETPGVINVSIESIERQPDGLRVTLATNVTDPAYIGIGYARGEEELLEADQIIVESPQGLSFVTDELPEGTFRLFGIVATDDLVGLSDPILSDVLGLSQPAPCSPPLGGSISVGNNLGCSPQLTTTLRSSLLNRSYAVIIRCGSPDYDFFFGFSGFPDNGIYNTSTGTGNPSVDGRLRLLFGTTLTVAGGQQVYVTSDNNNVKTMTFCDLEFEDFGGSISGSYLLPGE